MKENTATQSKHLTLNLKKTPHLITILAFFLQQLVPYSSAFAMDPDDFNNAEPYRRNPSRVTNNLQNSTDPDPEVQYQFGERYLYGQGVVQNLESAMEWYQKAAHNGHAAGVKVLKLIESQKDQEEVDLSSQNLTPVDIRFVITFLRNRPLKKLSLEWNGLGAEGIRIISEGLKYSPNLQYLNVGANGMGDEGARFISGGLKYTPSLQHLNMEANDIGDEGAHFVSKGFKHVPLLKQLDLRFNRIGDEGARFISDTLKHTPALQQLDLENNNLGVEGERLMRAVLPNTFQGTFPAVSPLPPVVISPTPTETPKSRNKKSLKSPPKKAPLPAFNLAYLKTLKLEDLEKDLEQRRFKTITETDQRALFELMKGHKFRNLVLREARALQDKFFFKEVQLAHLLILNLEGSVSLSDRIIPLIAEKALSLESLTLSHIPNMKEIGKQRKGFFDASPLYIFFPSLRYLNISYGGFNTVLIRADKLEVLKARAAKALQVLDIQQIFPDASGGLKKVDLREAQNLPLHAFVQLLQFYHEIKLQAEALQRLSPIPYKELALQHAFPLEAGNLERFIEQYRRATEANDPEAQYQLGEMYANGQDVLQNVENAMEWYQKAAHNGHPAGAKVLKLMEGQKTPEKVFFSEEELSPINIKILMIFLKKRPLKELTLITNNIGAEGARWISKGLRYTPDLQILVLGDNQIGDEGARFVSEGLKHVPSLQQLGLWKNNIGAEGARFISEGLKYTPSLQILALQKNEIGVEGTRFITTGLQHVTGLQRLELNWNKIGAKGARFVSEGLKYTPVLQILVLEGNEIGAEGARFITTGLQHVPGLQRLELTWNKIGDKGARFISEGLKYIRGLQMLILHNNEIGADGAHFISEGVQHASNLQQLNLGNNNIGAEGVRFIGDALKYTTGLQQLSLWGNSMGKEGAHIISESLKHVSNLQQLNLGNNNIGAEGARFISEGVKYTPGLQQLNLGNPRYTNLDALFLSAKEMNLGNNNIGAEGARFISEGLKYIPALQQLDLYGNKIGADGVRWISEGLQHVSNLQQLNLGNNNIGVEGARFIGESLHHVPALQKLSFDSIGDEGIRFIDELKKKYPNLLIN